MKHPWCWGALALLALTACGDGGAKEAACDRLESVAGLTLEAVLEPGPHPVGNHEATLSYEGMCFGEAGQTPCVRELRTSVYYPASAEGEDAPLAAGGPFPLVVYSHGFMSTRGENTSLLKRLASRGYVALAATFPNTSLAAAEIVLFDVVNQPADVSFLIDWISGLVDGTPSPLPDAIDESKIVTGGLSLGGMTTLLVTYHGALRDPRITAAFGIAPPTAIFTSNFYETTAVPFLLLAGSEDAVVTYAENGEGGFEAMRTPAEFMTLLAGSHLGFAEQGVLLGASFDHPDELACQTLSGQLPAGGDASGWADFGELGGAEWGVDLTADMGAMCAAEELPLAMRPRRQLDLTTASVVSFLEARVRGDESHARFLAEGIPFDGCDAVYETK